MNNLLHRGLIETGYFLSKMGLKEPPLELHAKTWNEAYLKFYKTFGAFKTQREFINSLKNIRDHFDSHLANSRRGWLDEHQEPQKLSQLNQSVFNELEELTKNELWSKIRPYSLLAYDEKASDRIDKIARTGGAKYFSSEFSGVRTSPKRQSSQIMVNHGFIVDELKLFVESIDERYLVYNTQKIDLAVELDNQLIAIYEVKTLADTQSIYTAIGQVFVHSVGIENLEKYLVLPKTSNNNELIDCLNYLGLKTIHYAVHNNKCEFFVN